MVTRETKCVCVTIHPGTSEHDYDDGIVDCRREGDKIAIIARGNFEVTREEAHAFAEQLLELIRTPYSGRVPVEPAMV